MIYNLSNRGGGSTIVSVDRVIVPALTINLIQLSVIIVTSLYFPQCQAHVQYHALFSVSNMAKTLASKMAI